jgi:hypothetical protein
MALLIGLLVVAFFVWAIRASAKERRLNEAISANARDSKANHFRDNLDSARGKFAGWTPNIVAKVNGQTSFVALSPDDQLAVTHLSNARDIRDDDQLLLPRAELVSAALEGSMVTKRMQVTEREPLIVQQKKSAVARALVGGALLGPVGAIAGAGSGLNKKTEIRYRDRQVWKQVECEGPKTLVVGTADRRSPVLRIECPSDSLTVEWFHRLNALIGRDA